MMQEARKHLKPSFQKVPHQVISFASSGFILRVLPISNKKNIILAPKFYLTEVTP